MLRGAWLQAKDLDDGINESINGLKRLMENDTTGLTKIFLEMNETYAVASSKILYYLEQAGVREIATTQEDTK